MQIKIKNFMKNVKSNYLYYHQADFPIGSVISPTEELNETFKPHVPSIFIHNQYSPELIEHILKRQKDIIKKQKSDPKYRNVDTRAFCIMDDCFHILKQGVQRRKRMSHMCTCCLTNSS